jgi:pilus assembly protein CpaB
LPQVSSYSWRAVFLAAARNPSEPRWPSAVATRGVLVASASLEPGTQLTAENVRWQEWPRSAVDSTFITQDAQPDIAKIVAGAVVRAPLVAGEPLSTTKMVHADATGLMAAMVTPGMRAISIPISTETDAGGFILPNDRVDVLSTLQISDSPRRFKARTILNSVRVLAVDQTFESKDQKTVLAKTATLELSPQQAELVERAQAAGPLSLALRALGDGDPTKLAASNATNSASGKTQEDATQISIIRYGVERPTAVGVKE